MTSFLRTLRYLRGWTLDPPGVESRQVTLERDGAPVPATWVTPPGDAPRGTWVVLHGLTRTGRSHAQLVRFTRALAATGSAVLVPEVPEWQALHLAPEATVPTVEAALGWLDGLPGERGTTRGLVGFSFGAPQAFLASGAPSLRGRLAGVVGFGGYCDLERTVLFQLTGEHEWEGETRRHRPDPYGRWIVAGNHLTSIPEYRDHGDVARALLALARRAGDEAVPSWAQALDPVKEELRRGLPPERRAMFDFLAPRGGGDPSGPEARDFARRLTEAALEASPGMEVRSRLASVPGPVHVLHGLNDHLVPFTEAWRLAEALPTGAVAQVRVTALFGHSAQDPFPWRRGVQETVGFLKAMTRLLGVV